MAETGQRPPYGATVWIALAWLCLTATAAITFLTLQLTEHNCVKFCFSPATAIGLSMVLVMPFLLAALATVFALTPATRRWLRSANTAGFVTALIAVPLSAGLLYLFATVFL